LEYSIYKELDKVLSKRGLEMNTEIKELNRMICNQCEEKDYEKCKVCKVYQLVNKIATQ